MFISKSKYLASMGITRMPGIGRAPYRSWKRTHRKQWDRQRKAYK